MFHKARIQLTLWYLLILMTVSVIFSAILYFRSPMIVEKGLQTQRTEQFHKVYPLRKTPPASFMPITKSTVDSSLDDVMLSLFAINSFILIFCGWGSFFLAGKTLNPIRRMITDQEQFIADASHELLTPLTNLHAEIEAVLRNKSLSIKEAESIFFSNLEEVIRLESLSIRLLQLAQYQRENSKPSFKEISSLEIIDIAWKHVQHFAKNKNIVLKKLFIKDHAIYGDKESLQELLIILFDNAIKYSSNNTTISINVVNNDNMVVLIMRDQGRGIARKDISHIFDRFYRVDASRSQKNISGYGLGLSIAKQIVELHRGSISVVSNEGIGTIFTCKVPASQK